MSEESKKDSGLLGIAGAGAAGIGAGYGVNEYMSNRIVKKALTSEKLGAEAAKIADDGKITGGNAAIKKAVGESELVGRISGKQRAIEAGYKAIGTNLPDNITGEISRTDKGFTLKIGRHELPGLKTLPKGLPEAAGTIGAGATHALTGEDLKNFFAEGNKPNVEKFLKGQQKQVLRELREPLGAKLLSTKNWGGKAAVVGGAVGAAYLAKVVFDTAFGSRGHTERLEAERAQQPAATGVGV